MCSPGSPSTREVPHPAVLHLEHCGGPPPPTCRSRFASMEQIPSLVALTLLRPEESDCTQALWIIHNVFIRAPPAEVGLCFLVSALLICVWFCFVE